MFEWQPVCGTSSAYIGFQTFSKMNKMLLKKDEIYSFCHLELEIALAIPAPNDEKRNRQFREMKWIGL